MKSRILTSAACASALVLAACGQAKEDNAATHDPVAAASWGYEGEDGPDQWASLSGDNAVCEAGTLQSPIDIPSAGNKGDGVIPDLAIDWTSGPLMLDGKDFTTNIGGPEGSTITVDGKTYNLVQMHMHAPSEELIDGKQYAADAHFVHADADGNLAVVGVLFEEGEENADLASMLAALNKDKGERAVEGATFNPSALLPADKDYFAYQGSLTTPPCSEGVSWFVMKNPMTISAAQVKMFTDLYGNTARPVQPVNDREIELADK